MSADSTIKQEALSNGAVSFKNKPFSLQRLFSNIQKALE